MTTSEMTAIERRQAKNAKHNPWDRLSSQDRGSQLSILDARPIKWTLDLTKINTVSEDGYMYVYAGGPLEGSARVEPHKRSDGKIDGRSKGVRKCGRCGGKGHNARTCKGPKFVKPETAPVADSKPAVKAAPKADTAPESRAACIKVPGKKTCSKCGQTGHNARTCGKTVTMAQKPSQTRQNAPKGKPGRPAVRHAQAPTSPLKGRQKTCGRCGGKGHNARTCKG